MLPRAGYSLTLCHPPEFSLDDDTIRRARSGAQESGTEFEICSRPEQALADDTVVLYPRNWTTTRLSEHGIETEKSLHNKYSEWSFSQAQMSDLAPNAYFMHCLPVDRGFEAKNCLIDGASSLIREQMLNRVPVQARLIDLLLKGA